MTLKEELKALKPLFGTETPEFYECVQRIADTYQTEENKKEISAFMDECLHNVDAKLNHLEEQTIKLQLQEVSEMISLSWLAKKYFGKTRAWIYQRINGNIVNGKVCKFTEEELNTLNMALKDISAKTDSLHISY